MDDDETVVVVVMQTYLLGERAPVSGAHVGGVEEGGVLDHVDIRHLDVVELGHHLDQTAQVARLVVRHPRALRGGRRERETSVGRGARSIGVPASFVKLKEGCACRTQRNYTASQV